MNHRILKLFSPFSSTIRSSMRSIRRSRVFDNKENNNHTIETNELNRNGKFIFESGWLWVSLNDNKWNCTMCHKCMIQMKWKQNNNSGSSKQQTAITHALIKVTAIHCIVEQSYTHGTVYNYNSTYYTRTRSRAHTHTYTLNACFYPPYVTHSHTHRVKEKLLLLTVIEYAHYYTTKCYYVTQRKAILRHSPICV